VKAPYTPYAPAQVFIVKPNGDTEAWSFKEARWNVPEIDETAFQYVPIPGWEFKTTRPMPVPRPPADEAAKP